MRTAICISGLRRSWENLKFNICTNVIKNSDVFYVTDAELDIQNVNKIILNENQNLYSPGDMEFFEKHKNGSVTVENCLNMFYKIYKCNELKKKYEQENKFKYDACIRLRTDTLFEREIIIEEVQENTLYIPEDKGYGGICDQFSYGDSDVMDSYSNIFNNLRSYVLEGCIFHPETILKYHCDKQNLSYKYIGTDLFNIKRI